MDLGQSHIRRKVPYLNRKWKIIFLALLIVTITVQGYSIYVYANSQWADGEANCCYIVWVLESEPENYWNLTNPDPYILEAIEHPGNWTEPFNYKDSTFWFTAIWDNPDAPSEPHPIQPVSFKYNGTYYNYLAAFPGRRLRVNLLDEEPENYWNLTNPDKYTLKAIENLGETIVVGINATLNLQPGPFKYDEKYYEYDVFYVDAQLPLPLPVKPENTAAVLAGVWVATGSVYVLKNRRTKAKS